MSAPINGTPGNQSVPNGDIQRPVSPAGGNTNKAEKLLDINGLLQIARLIEEIKKDDRLKSVGKERLKDANE